MANRKQPPQITKSYPREGMASVPDAAEFLKLSRATIYRLVNNEQLRFTRFGDGNIRIPWSALHEIAK